MKAKKQFLKWSDDIAMFLSEPREKADPLRMVALVRGVIESTLVLNTTLTSVRGKVTSYPEPCPHRSVWRVTIGFF
jgi:hypothetical protein